MAEEKDAFEEWLEAFNRYMMRQDRLVTHEEICLAAWTAGQAEAERPPRGELRAKIEANGAIAKIEVIGMPDDFAERLVKAFSDSRGEQD